MRSPGDQVQLRWLWGEFPEPGDTLQTRTGRRYLVLARRHRRIDTVVLAPNDEVPGQIIPFQWASRRRRRVMR